LIAIDCRTGEIKLWKVPLIAVDCR